MYISACIAGLLQNKTPWLYSSYAFICCNLDAFDWQHEPLPWTLPPDVLTGIATKYLDIAKFGRPWQRFCCNHLGFAIGEDVIRSRRWGHWSHQSWNIAAWCRKTSFDLQMMLSMAVVQSHEAQKLLCSKCEARSAGASVLSGWPLSKFCKRPSRLNPLQLAGVKPPCLPSHRDRQRLLVGCVLPHETEDMAQRRPHGNNSTKFGTNYPSGRSFMAAKNHQVGCTIKTPNVRCLFFKYLKTYTYAYVSKICTPLFLPKIRGLITICSSFKWS
jgi:hypothetical protein